MYKVLVTGGSGLIGSNLIPYLVNCGYEVSNFDIKEPLDKSQNVFFNKVDILDKSTLISKVLNFKPDYLIHLAAKADLNGKNLK